MPMNTDVGEEDTLGMSDFEIIATVATVFLPLLPLMETVSPSNKFMDVMAGSVIPTTVWPDVSSSEYLYTCMAVLCDVEGDVKIAMETSTASVLDGDDVADVDFFFFFFFLGLEGPDGYGSVEPPLISIIRSKLALFILPHDDTVVFPETENNDAFATVTPCFEDWSSKTADANNLNMIPRSSLRSVDVDTF